MKRLSKTDMGPIRRKAKPPAKIRTVIKREVMSSELMYAVNRIKQAIAASEPVKPVVSGSAGRFGWWQLGSFTFVSIALIVVLQSLVYLSQAKKASGEILGAATSAYADLHSAGQNLSTQNFSAAQQLFDAAIANINLAQGKLSNFRALTWVQPLANSADHVLAGAGDLASAGNKLTEALSLFDELKVSSKGVETPDFNDKIKINRDLLAESRDLIASASEQFNSAGSLPLDYSGTLETAKQQAGELGTILDKLIGLEDLYLQFFSKQKTYLLIFQNYDEARATGGFIGTYGVLKIDHGLITKLKIESIYQLDGQIYEQVAAPGPMQPQIKRWGIRDANWFADFPTTAEKLLYFFEKGGETADGVISATPKMFEDILRLTGPVDMHEYKLALTADNFQELVQFKTSVDYDKIINQPKKFLADAAPRILDRLHDLNKDQWFQVFQIFENNFRQRNILLYSKDHATEKNIKDMGFGGEILSTDYDYLSINNSNLGGTKTDLSMDQNVELRAKVLSDGSIINTLTIVRKNSADASNKNFLRVMVPALSEFISASGFDEYKHEDSMSQGMRTDPDLAAWDRGEFHSNVFVRLETGKTEFTGWLATSPGETRSITLVYMLPFKINADRLNSVQSYSLLLQKQSGAKPYSFSGSVNLGHLQWKWLGPGVDVLGNTLNFKSKSNTDDFWPIVLSK